MSDFAITVCLIGLFAFIAGFYYLISRPKVNRKRLAILSNSQERLKSLTAELLEKANRLDQDLKFIEKQSERSASSRKLKAAMDDLVILLDTLPTIDQLVEERRISDCNSLLSASCQLAEKVSGLLDDVEGDTKLLEDSIRTRTKSNKPQSKAKKLEIVDVEVVD